MLNQMCVYPFLVLSFSTDGTGVFLLQYLGTGDGAKRGKLLSQSLIINAVIQVLHIEIHTLETN